MTKKNNELPTLDNPDKDFLSKVSDTVIKNNYIDPSLYNKYDVKRGLRNNDGTGVLIGLTRIGEVHGYIIDEGTKTPVEGKLRYRGVNVRDIVTNAQTEDRFGYEEVCYLLLFGELPTQKQLNEFNEHLGSRRKLPNGFIEDMILKAPSQDIMNKLARSILAAYSYDNNPDDTSINSVLERCVDLIARFPTMVAYAYQAKSHYYNGQSLYIHSPQPELSTAENFLYMLRPDNQYTRQEAQILDMALILHAEHGGGNNSAFATRVVSSSGTDTYSAIAAAVGSLKGPKHGGASEKVMSMMDDIKAHVKNWSDEKEVEDYLVKILRKEAFDKSGLIYGMGHAIYTYSDPRAVLLKEKAIELAKVKGFEEELNLYLSIEKMTPRLFAEVRNNDKELCANVDMYSGFVYKMLGIPLELHTPLFAVSRIAGWCAHRIEELISGGRIIRPAYRTVTKRRNYIPIKER